SCDDDRFRNHQAPPPAPASRTTPRIIGTSLPRFFFAGASGASVGAGTAAAAGVAIGRSGACAGCTARGASPVPVRPRLLRLPDRRETGAGLVSEVRRVPPSGV